MLKMRIHHIINFFSALMMIWLTPVFKKFYFNFSFIFFKYLYIYILELPEIIIKMQEIHEKNCNFLDVIGDSEEKYHIFK